ncbi:hypothetical protein D9M71_802060 [compost metagenome]
MTALRAIGRAEGALVFCLLAIMHVTTSVSVSVSCDALVWRLYHCDWPNSMAMTALVVGHMSPLRAPFSP